MQDEGGAKGLNPVLEKHWEKIVLGVVIAAGVVYAGTQFSGSGNPAAKSVDAANAALKKKQGEPNPSIKAPKAWDAPKIPSVAAAESAKVWTPGQPTIFTPEIKRGPTEIVSFFFPSLTLSAPQSGTDGITLSWSLGQEQPDKAWKIQPHQPKPSTFYFQIDRRKKGEAEWQTLEKNAKGDSTRYIDTKTEPKTDYEYRVTLGCNDPKFSAKNPKNLTDKIGGPGAVRTPGIWTFNFSNVQSFPDAPDPKPGQVYVTIRKFDRDAGWVEWRKIQYEGDMLGVVKEGGVEVSKHRVPGKGGKPVIVDFKSGGVIKRITADKLLLYEYKKCKMVPDGMGGLICDGKPETIKASYKVNEVLFTDEDGKDQSDVHDSGPGKIPDQFCEAHGGAPPPKEPSPTERAAGREEAAGKLLDEADRLWDSAKVEEKKHAQEKYKKLLADYGDTAGVKARAADIKARSVKKLE